MVTPSKRWAVKNVVVTDAQYDALSFALRLLSDDDSPIMNRHDTRAPARQVETEGPNVYCGRSGPLATYHVSPIFCIRKASTMSPPAVGARTPF